MLATIDWVARRYGVLPSRLLQEGDSIDIILATLGQRYENFVTENQRRKSKGQAPVAPDLTQEEMMAMLERAKKKTGKK